MIFYFINIFILCQLFNVRFHLRIMFFGHFSFKSQYKTGKPLLKPSVYYFSLILKKACLLYCYVYPSVWHPSVVGRCTQKWKQVCSQLYKKGHCLSRLNDWRKPAYVTREKYNQKIKLTFWLNRLNFFLNIEKYTQINCSQ